MRPEHEPDYLKLMTKMVDVIAHDIRNPLNNILLSTAQFKLETLPDKEDTAFYVDIIERSCDRVSGLLEEIIGVIHQPGLHPGTFDLAELLQELVQENEERLEGKDMKFDASLKTVVIARFDRDMLKRALLRIIDNAVDVSAKGGIISISVRETEDDVLIGIADEGEGIPPEIQPHIFAPFFTTRERQKGLGLTIAYNIIHAHQGKIDIRSSVDGTTVMVALPRQR